MARFVLLLLVALLLATGANAMFKKGKKTTTPVVIAPTTEAKLEFGICAQANDEKARSMGLNIPGYPFTKCQIHVSTTGNGKESCKYDGSHFCEVDPFLRIKGFSDFAPAIDSHNFDRQGDACEADAVKGLALREAFNKVITDRAKMITSRGATLRNYAEKFKEQAKGIEGGGAKWQAFRDGLMKLAKKAPILIEYEGEKRWAQCAVEETPCTTAIKVWREDKLGFSKIDPTETYTAEQYMCRNRGIVGPVRMAEVTMKDFLARPGDFKHHKVMVFEGHGLGRTNTLLPQVKVDANAFSGFPSLITKEKAPEIIGGDVIISWDEATVLHHKNFLSHLRDNFRNTGFKVFVLSFCNERLLTMEQLLDGKTLDSDTVEDGKMYVVYSTDVYNTIATILTAVNPGGINTHLTSFKIVQIDKLINAL